MDWRGKKWKEKGKERKEGKREEKSSKRLILSIFLNFFLFLECENKVGIVIFLANIHYYKGLSWCLKKKHI